MKIIGLTGPSGAGKSQLCKYLAKEGMLFFEIGYDQAKAVSAMMEEAGFKEITVVKDFAGLDRVVYGSC